jgi:hypothetical protein
MGTGKIAVAVVHGIGTQAEDFEKEVAKDLHDLCRPACGDEVEREIVIKGVHWASVLNSRQNDLMKRINVDDLHGPWRGIRTFLITYAADVLAYADPASWVYKGVHTKFAMTLRSLMEETSPTAPLFIVSHSLGTVIASNYLWDLQQEYKLRGQNENIPRAARSVWQHDPTPLEQGRTLTMLYMLGSPLGLWSLRFVNDDDNVPIDAPPNIDGWLFDDLNLPQGWVNMYDREDIIGYPLRGLNQFYADRVQDVVVNVGNKITSRTPLSHILYFKDEDVTQEIASKLIETWRVVSRSDSVPQI